MPKKKPIAVSNGQAKRSSKKNVSPALRHWRKTRRAECALETIRSFEGENVIPRVIAYLRKVDPFVFEEILLCALDEAGFDIRRNWRYTGDGGIDGRVKDANGNKIIIQAKRYTGYVKSEDVKSFADAVTRSNVQYGIFGHTGRTGPKSRWKRGKNVSIISGNHLVRLLLKPAETWLRFPSAATKATIG